MEKARLLSERDQLVMDNELQIGEVTARLKQELSTQAATAAAEQKRAAAQAQSLRDELTTRQGALEGLRRQLATMGRERDRLVEENAAAQQEVKAVADALWLREQEKKTLAEQLRHERGTWAARTANLEKTLEVLRATLVEDRALRFRRLLGTGLAELRNLRPRRTLIDAASMTAGRVGDELGIAAEPESSAPPATSATEPVRTEPEEPELMLWHADPFGEPHWQPDAQRWAGHVRAAADLKLVANLEASLAAGVTLDTPWVGFSHVPLAMPDWLKAQASWRPWLDGSLFATDQWLASRGQCKKLFAFSSSHARALEAHAGAPVEVIRYPISPGCGSWSREGFEANEHKRVVQFGTGTQRRHAIFLVPENGFRRVHLQPAGATAEELSAAEAKHLGDRWLFGDFLRDGVSTIPFAGEDWPGDLFGTSIVLFHYYDLSTPSLLMACVSRHTPLLVNPVPAVVEYLGEEYPLYYSSYQEAVDRADDLERVVEAHRYLARVSKEGRFQPETFRRALVSGLSGAGMTE